jgi:hypothetical protein
MSNLAKLGCLSRSQLQMLLDIPDVRMMNRILRNMSKYLNYTKLNEHVYYLNKNGRETIGAEWEYKKNSRIEHDVMRNDIYIFYHRPSDWKIECPTDWKENGKEYQLISDARFAYHDMIYFVEVDVQQKMTVNKQKIKKYTSLFRVMNQKGMDPILLWYTVSEVRKERLEKWCKEYGVPCEVLCKL